MSKFNGAWAAQGLCPWCGKSDTLETKSYRNVDPQEVIVRIWCWKCSALFDRVYELKRIEAVQ